MHSIVDLVPAAPPAYDRHAASVARRAAAVLVHGAAGALFCRAAALWARIAQNVKKSLLTVNVIHFDFVLFDVSI